MWSKNEVSWWNKEFYMWQSNLETLVLALHCYCGDNVKYGLFSITKDNEF